MSSAPKGRAGIGISAKLVLATSVVVALAIGAATWFSQRTLDQVTAKSIDDRQKEGQKRITRESELLVKSVANAAANPLGLSLYPEVNAVLDAALRDDRASGDKRVQWLVVHDQTGQVVSSTKGAPTGPALVAAEQKLAGQTGDVVRAQLVEGGSDWVYATDIKASASTKAGSVTMGVTTADLQAALAKQLEESRQKARASRERVLLVGLALLGIGILFAAIQGLRLARPIKALTSQAAKIAGGDLSSRVPEGRRDELGVLAHTFNFMSDAIVQLLAEQAQKASLEKEMELARQVQQAMLPPTLLDEHGHFKVVGYCMPASQCGGDWWTYRKLSNGRMLIVVGDATGHGMHSAMIAATARGAVEALASADEKLLTPEQVLRAIDQSIRMVGDHNVLMTAFAAVFDSTNGALHYANAGQNFPYVMKLGAQRVIGSASIIAASGNPLGDRNIAVEIRRGSLQLTPGDVFVCFTDGVVERANPQGKLFGDRRLRGALTGQPVPDGQALVQLRDRVVNTLEQYANGALADDDITFVLCQFDPPRGSMQQIPGRGAA